MSTGNHFYKDVDAKELVRLKEKCKRNFLRFFVDDLFEENYRITILCKFKRFEEMH